MDDSPFRRLWNCVPAALTDAQAILLKRKQLIAGAVVFAVLVAAFYHPRLGAVIGIAETASGIVWWFFFADSIRRIEPEFTMTDGRLLRVVGYMFIVAVLMALCNLPAILLVHHFPRGASDPAWWLVQPLVVFVIARLAFVYYLAVLLDDGRPIADSWALSGGRMLWPTVALATVNFIFTVAIYLGTRSLPPLYWVASDVLITMVIQTFELPLRLRWMNVCLEYNALPRPEFGIETV